MNDKLLVENNDIDGQRRPNSRILFTPKQNGTYRLIATSFQQRGHGAYEIIMREFVHIKQSKE